MNNNHTKKTAIEGSLDFHTPLKILDAVLVQENEVVLSCLVSFRALKSGIVPEPGWFLTTDIREKAPKILIDYLLMNTRFA